MIKNCMDTTGYLITGTNILTLTPMRKLVSYWIIPKQNGNGKLLKLIHLGFGAEKKHIVIILPFVKMKWESRNKISSFVILLIFRKLEFFPTKIEQWNNGRSSNWGNKNQVQFLIWIYLIFFFFLDSQKKKKKKWENIEKKWEKIRRNKIRATKVSKLSRVKKLHHHFQFCWSHEKLAKNGMKLSFIDGTQQVICLEAETHSGGCFDRHAHYALYE